MGEEFKDFEVEAPVLTLEPDLTEEKEEIAAKEPEKPQEPAVEEPVLSPQEQKIVEDFAAKIDIENTNQILQYGAGTQKKMADFSDTALANVRTQDLGEVGDLLSSVVGTFWFLQKTDGEGGNPEKPLHKSRGKCGEDHRSSGAAPDASDEGFCSTG
jgi:uncharacterized protein YaaN involved in tellurite resistance